MIYMLEDDPTIRNFVLYALDSSGITAQGFEYPSDLWTAINRKIPDLLLLDIMLPEEDGLSVLRNLRENSSTKKLPVIMLSAKDSEFDKVTALDAGADDYVSKPFGTMELVSRIKALLRRSGDNEPEEILSAGKVRIYTEKHEVISGDKKINLTLKEYELLSWLIRNKGIVFSRDTLLQKIWGYDFAGESRTVDVHIRTLRSKLGEYGDIIHTIRGVGYKIGGDLND